MVTRLVACDVMVAVFVVADATEKHWGFRK